MTDGAGGRVLGIIAGAGPLPRLIAEDRRAQGLGWFVCAFEGVAPDWLAGHPHAVVPFEKPGALFRALRGAGVQDVVFAGGLSRPSLRPFLFDLKAVALARSVLPLLRKGDDALLRGLGAVFEQEGFRLIGAHEALGGLLAPCGPLSAAVAGPSDLEDARRAAAIVDAVGALDIGQAAVVAEGVCLGIETIQGTDALLDFVAATPARLRTQARSGVLFKGPKPGQDRRMDLPTIGPETVRRAAAADLRGVAVRAGATLVLGLEATRAAADAAGLFLLGIDGDRP